MATQNPKELFVKLLSDVRQHEERTAEILQEMTEAVKDEDIKEMLESRVFLKNQTLNTLDRCFKLIGEQPKKLSDKFHDIFVENFRTELSEIKSPAARLLYVIAKAKHLIHFRMGEYVALIAMADITGHYGVGSLLENCLADKVAFIERARRRIRNIIESEMVVGAT
jgi:ferritin-like metal-binding protein YciE